MACVASLVQVMKLTDHYQAIVVGGCNVVITILLNFQYLHYSV